MQVVLTTPQAMVCVPFGMSLAKLTSGQTEVNGVDTSFKVSFPMCSTLQENVWEVLPLSITLVAEPVSYLLHSPKTNEL